MDAAGVVDKLGKRTDGRLAVRDWGIAYVVPFERHGGTYAEKIVRSLGADIGTPKEGRTDVTA
jgi:NADPH:quinone reductase-like Zn-dependent oxidoreductase